MVCKSGRALTIGEATFAILWYTPRTFPSFVYVCVCATKRSVETERKNSANMFRVFFDTLNGFFSLSLSDSPLRFCFISSK